MPDQRLRAVSIGGGTGQPRLIAALRLMGAHIDSVVAMADDGGSTGLLREREHMVPPGDVRKCLSALAADPASPLARAFAHRFSYIDDHALGREAGLGALGRRGRPRGRRRRRPRRCRTRLDDSGGQGGALRADTRVGGRYRAYSGARGLCCHQGFHGRGVPRGSRCRSPCPGAGRGGEVVVVHGRGSR